MKGGEECDIPRFAGIVFSRWEYVLLLESLARLVRAFSTASAIPECFRNAYRTACWVRDLGKLVK